MSKKIDMSGKRYGKLVGIRYLENYKWLFRCDCGKEKAINGPKVRRAEIVSCGCQRSEFSSRKAIDETGNKYHMLTVVDRSGTVNGKAAWLVRCECGEEKTITGDALRSGNSISCGCNRKEALRILNETRSASAVAAKHPRAYDTWRKVLGRCLNEADSCYPRYGAKGISVDERWLDFSTFLADMGDPLPGMTIDRKDGLLGYSLSNCRWADRRTQSRNRKTTKLTLDDANSIRVKLGNGSSVSSLAKTYGVSSWLVGNIRDGKVWSGPAFFQPAGTLLVEKFDGTERRAA